MRSRKPLLALAFLGTVMAVPALAQQPSAPYPPACDASKVTKADVERAHQVFLSGKQFLDESNYDKAISYFKDAYSIDCSVHGILPIIATAYERKGDKAEAVHALEEYLKRAPSAPDHDVIERRIANLKQQLAAAQPSATSGAGAPAASATATAAPSATAAPTATASAEPSATTTATAPDVTGATPVEATARGSILPWVLVGVGGAAVVTGAILFPVGAGDVSTAENTCKDHGNCNDPKARDTGNTGRTLETVGVVAGSVGAAAVVGGLVWHAVEHRHRGTGTAVTPVVTPGYAGVSVGGAF